MPDAVAVPVAGAGRVARIETEPSVPIWATCLALVKVTSAAPPGCSVMFSGFCRALLSKWATTRGSLSGAVAAEAGTASAMEQLASAVTLSSLSKMNLLGCPMRAGATGERVLSMAVPGDGHRGEVATLPYAVKKAGLTISLRLPRRLLPAYLEGTGRPARFGGAGKRLLPASALDRGHRVREPAPPVFSMVL